MERLLQPYAGSFDRSVLSVAFHPTEPRLVTGSQYRTVKVWSFSTELKSEPINVGNIIDKINTMHAVNSLSFNDDGKFLATSSNQEFSARIWSMSDMTKRVTTLSVDTIRHPVSCIAFGQYGYLVTGYNDDSDMMRLWQFSYRDNKAVYHATLSGHTEYVISLAFHPILNIFASGSFDNTAKIWSIVSNGKNATCVATLLGHTGCVVSVAFHPDPTVPLFATGSYDNTAKLWRYSPDSSIVTCVATLTGHTDFVLSVAFHPKVPLLATGSRDKTAKLWRFLRDGTIATCVETITYTEKVRSLSFHPRLPVLAICHDGVNSVTLYDCTKIPTYYDKYMKDMESERKMKLYKMAIALSSRLFTPPPGYGIVPQKPLRDAKIQLEQRVAEKLKQGGRRGGSKRAKTRYKKRSRTRCKSRSTSKTR
jgi:WD40 repeat protein